MPIAPEARLRLARLMDARRRELRLRWQDVAEAGEVSLKTLHSVRTGDAGIAPLSERGIEVGLRWEAGTVGIILAGGDPVPLADPAGAPRAVPPVPARREIPFHAVGVSEEDLQPYISEIRQAAYGILVSLFGDQVPAPPDPGAEVAIAALPGRLLFPGDDEFARLEAEAWDKTALTLGEKVKIIAIGRFLAGLAAGEQGRRTGLGPAAVTPVTSQTLEPVTGKLLRASS